MLLLLDAVSGRLTGPVVLPLSSACRLARKPASLRRLCPGTERWGLAAGTERQGRGAMAQEIYFATNRRVVKDGADAEISEEFHPDIDELRFGRVSRSEEHTSELQSIMRRSEAVFCLKK